MVIIMIRMMGMTTMVPMVIVDDDANVDKDDCGGYDRDDGV